MRLCRFAPALVALCLLATPASADWRTAQSNGRAAAVYQTGKFELRIGCRRGQGFTLSLEDLASSGSAFRNVQSLMMWVELPDGRTDRWPVGVVREDAGISGELVVSDFNLEFFRNAQSFELDSPQTRQTFLSGDMRGSGAARLAFLEQCGL